MGMPGVNGNHQGSAKVKNKHQIEIMSAYLAYLSIGAKMNGLGEESNRAGAAAQLLQWVVDQKNASSDALDESYRAAKSAFRQLKKQFPSASHPELLDLLPSFLLDETMKSAMAQGPIPSNQ
jgi:hypothetical protein